MNGYPFLSWVRKDPVAWRARGWTLTEDRKAVKTCRPRKPLRIMPANNSSALTHYLAGRYPQHIGWLVGPRATPKTKFREWMPFALDNDAFSAWANGTEWDEVEWLTMLEMVKALRIKPLWVLVPDVVADREATLENWKHYSPIVGGFGFKKAFALQDGMSKSDIPPGAEVLFVGGTTEWKWRTVADWVSLPQDIHVGRVNSVEKLTYCERIGVASVDGTGWMKDIEPRGKAELLTRWLAGERFTHPELALEGINDG